METFSFELICLNSKIHGYATEPAVKAKGCRNPSILEIHILLSISIVLYLCFASVSSTVLHPLNSTQF